MNVYAVYRNHKIYVKELKSGDLEYSITDQRTRNKWEKGSYIGPPYISVGDMITELKGNIDYWIDVLNEGRE
jgi:hypothetical protein